MCSDRSVSAVLSNASGMLGTAGREGTLTSNEQDVQKTPSRTYLRKLRLATRIWLSSILLFSVEIRIRLEYEKPAVFRVSRLNFVDCDSG